MIVSAPYRRAFSAVSIPSIRACIANALVITVSLMAIISCGTESYPVTVIVEKVIDREVPVTVVVEKQVDREIPVTVMVERVVEVPVVQTVVVREVVEVPVVQTVVVREIEETEREEVPVVQTVVVEREVPGETVIQTVVVTEREEVPVVQTVVVEREVVREVTGETVVQTVVVTEREEVEVPVVQTVIVTEREEVPVVQTVVIREIEEVPVVPTALDERESSQNSQQEVESMIEDTYSSGATYSVTIRTNKGDIEADLYNDIAGIYVRNFVNLARSGFYDGSPWHRVIPGFVIQGGQNAEGRTVPQFADEFHPDMKHDSAGILSMANAGFNTNTSQFFITHDATPHLDPYENGVMKPCEVTGTSCHAVFGKVTTGMDIVLEIEQGDVMESVEIHEQ